MKINDSPFYTPLKDPWESLDPTLKATALRYAAFYVATDNTSLFGIETEGESCAVLQNRKFKGENCTNRS